MRIYVSSSWRNQRQSFVVEFLRGLGHEVYDFRNAASDYDGFRWSEIDPNWRNWTPERLVEGLEHHLAEEAFKYDFDAMQWADACVLVMPCGRSAHLEAGWFIGAGKPTTILLSDGEPELMYKMAKCVYDRLGLREWLEALKERQL